MQGHRRGRLQLSQQRGQSFKLQPLERIKHSRVAVGSVHAPGQLAAWLLLGGRQLPGTSDASVSLPSCWPPEPCQLGAWHCLRQPASPSAHEHSPDAEGFLPEIHQRLDSVFFGRAVRSACRRCCRPGSPAAMCSSFQVQICIVLQDRTRLWGGKLPFSSSNPQLPLALAAWQGLLVLVLVSEQVSSGIEGQLAPFEIWRHVPCHPAEWLRPYLRCTTSLSDSLNPRKGGTGL